MFKYLLKRNLALLIAVIMFFAILPGSAIAEGTEGLERLSAEEGTRGQINSGSGTWISGKLTYTYTSATESDNTEGASGSVSVSGSTLTIKATSAKQYDTGGCNSTTVDAAGTTTTAVVTNASSYPLLIDSLSVTGDAVVAGLAQGQTIAPGATFTISVTSPAAGTSSVEKSGTVTINASEQTSVTITAVASPYVSYSIYGNNVAQNGSSVQFTVDVGTVITFPAITAPSGYEFKGWRVGADLVTAVSFTADSGYSVYPVIVSSSTPTTGDNFKVGASYYTFWNDAVRAAILDNGVIVVAQDVMLPSTVEDNLLPAAGGTYLKPVSGGGVEYILPAGVTLLVPKNATAAVHTIPEYEYKAHVVPSAFRTLTVPNGARITVNGVVCVDSTVCGYGQNSDSWNGTPSGPHGKIVMKTGSEMTFNSNANLYCWGYINGDGIIYMKSGAKVYELFQLRCWRGGTATSNWKESSRVFPMNQYYVQNVEAPMRLYKGATEYVCTCVNASSNCYAANSIEFIGSNGMFKLTGNNTDYITKRYHANVDRLEVAVNGNMSLNALNIKISGLPLVGTIDVKSSDYVLPINNMEITVESGTTSIASTQTYGVAFLPSSKLTVNEGATFAVNAPTYFYDAVEWIGKGYGAGGADIVVVGYSTANGTTAIRTAANLKDAEIDNNGTVTVSNKLYTTESGATITSSKGTGVISFTTAPATESTTTCQATQSGTTITYHNINVNNAWLYNGDESYSYTVSTGVSTWKYDKPGEHWYRYLVDFEYDGIIIARDYYCEQNDTVTYDASWLTGVNATVKSGAANAAVSGTNVNVTNVTKDSVITLTGTAAEFIPTFVLSEKEYTKYQLYTGNTISNTTTINGATYYIVDQASSALAVGTAYAAPADASMGVTAENHNSIIWNLSGISYTSGDPYLGTVPAGGTPDGQVYIYGFYTGVVAYNSYTDAYYPTLIGAFQVLPQDVTATITLLADCGTFEEESGTVAYTAYPSNNITLDLNGHHAVGRIVNKGSFTLELNGGTFEYVTGAIAAAATFKGMAAIINSGTLTIQDSVGGGKITADAISNAAGSDGSAVIRNNAGASFTMTGGTLQNKPASVNNYSAALLNYGTASISDSIITTNRGYGIYNGSSGKITKLENTPVSVTLAGGANAVYNNAGIITTIDNCELSTLNTNVLYNHNGGTITTLKDSELTITTPTTKNVYVVFNYGGTITTIDNCTITGNSGINNRNLRGSNTIAQGYNISKYGVIDTITNSTVSVGQYAIYNGGRINTLSNSTFTAAPASAQVHWPSGTAALNGNTPCYTIVNSNLWWYDTAVWKRTDTNVDNNGTTMLQRRIDEYKTEDAYKPTIGTIDNCAIKALNTSTGAANGYALQNLGVINLITGNTTILTQKHPNNSMNIGSQYALQNVNGGKIMSIGESVIITATNYAIDNRGARYEKTDLTYSTTYLENGKLKSGGLTTDYDYTFADVSYIGSIAGTVTATGSYAIQNYSKIGSISGSVSAPYYVIVNQIAATTTTGIEVATANTEVAEHRYFDNDDPSTTNNEYRRYFEYTRNTTDGCYIGTINATVTATGAGYYAIYNQGYIGTIAGTVTTPTGKATSGSTYYPLIFNGNQRQATLKQDEYYYIETNDAGATKYLREYTYLAPTIDTISCTATNPQDYTIQNYGVINNLTGNISGKTITVANETGYYLGRKTIMFYYSATRFAATKGSSEVSYEYTKEQATINSVNGATISATNGATALRNYGHIGTIQSSTITSTGASTIINSNAGLTVTSYTSNRLDVLVGCVPSSSACALRYDTTQTINENETCAIASIELIGAGNTIRGTNNVIDNKGEITAIDSGSGTLTTITATGGIAVYNYQGSYDSRINNAAELTNSTGTLTNHYTYNYVPAEIGMIKNVYIQSTQNAIKNGEGNANYVPVRIGEIGDGAEFKSGNGYSAVYNYANNAQIEKITGGIFTSGTGNAYGLYNGSTTYPILISGGHFKGGDATRNKAILDPDNTNRQTYPEGMSLSADTEDVTLHDGTTGSDYYYIWNVITVTFNANDGVGTMDQQTVGAGKEFTLNTNTFTRDGYEFSGWNTAADGSGTAYGDGEEITLNVDTTLYAQWTEVAVTTYTVTWKNYDGTVLETDENVEADTIPSYNGPTPTKKATAEFTYTFAGWSDSIGGTVLSTLPNVTGNVTYYAVFHKWGALEWTWTGYTGATATFTCANDPSHVETVNATITSEITTAATCEGAGVKTYTATVTFNEQTYTDKKTETIPATGHAWGAPAWTWTGYTDATATFTCANDSTHTQTVTATITSEVTAAATCESTGVKTYTATVTFNGQTYTDTKTETLPATGHSWGAPAWSWTGYTGATATFTCANDASHVETVAATITSEVTAAATCESTGVKTYTATVTFNGQTYTDTKTETIPATGHSWGAPTYAWTQEGTSWKCTAKRICTNDASHVETEVGRVTGEVTAPATCTGMGTTTYTATFTNEAFTTQTKDVEDVPMLGHDWEFVDFTWTETSDGYSAVANYVCKNDNGHTRTESAAVMSATTPATCEADGQTVYTATHEGHTGTKTVTIPATGHAWGAPAWTWTDYTGATATFTCANDSTHTQTVNATITSEITTAATCEGAGVKTYTATVTFNGQTYTDTKTETIPSTGHAWGAPSWTWTGYTDATATFTCANDSTHTQTVNATITSEITTAATCEGAGVKTYTATVTFNEQTYTDKKTETIPATGHAWGAPAWTWTGYTDATATFTCANDSTHTQTVNATITSEITTAATCEGAGVKTYTATVTFNEQTYTDKKTETIPATGHAWGAPAWTWTGYTDATATFTCANDSTHTQTVNATITSEITTAATCEGAGVKTYTATVTFNGQTYTDTKTETIPATGHSWGAPTYAWTQEGTNWKCTAKRICANDASHVETEVGSVTGEITTPATCTGMGTTTYTATFNNEAFTTQTKDVEDVPMLGHDWEFVDFTWTETSDGYSAVANYVCKNDNGHTRTESAAVMSATTPATCEADGQTVYTATHEGHTDTKTFTIPAIGHNWGEPVWNWTGTESATATFTCANDPSHVETVNAEITSAEGTGENAGYTLYTAEVELDGETYKNVVRVGNTYIITFDPNGGDGTAYQQEFVFDENQGVKLNPNTFTREGYVFIGWSENRNSTECEYGDKATASFFGDTTLYAIWKIRTFTVKFFIGETCIDTQTVEYGKSADEPEYSSYIPAGYTFDGWEQDFSYITSDLNVYAKLSVEQFTITFVNEDGTELQSGLVAYGETPAYTGETPTKPATAQYTYAFTGWTPEITEVTGNATYTAQFSPTPRTYSVILNTVLGGTIAEGHKVTSYTCGTAVALPGAEYVTLTGYTFAGWYTDINYTGDPVTEISASDYGDKEFFAKWNANTYTVTFTVNGGYYSSSEFEYGKPVTAPEYTVPAGHTFSGWDCPATMPAENITLNATLTVNRYTIMFVNWNGDVLQSTQFAYGAMPEYYGDTPVRLADEDNTYTFACWTPNIEGVTGEATYTAVFHSWGAPTWAWAEDHMTATATFICGHCGIDHFENATVTVATADATCTADGAKTYTAKTTYNGREYTDTYTESIPAPGHDWNAPTYVWAEDNSTVTATRVCKNDEDHVETETVNTTAATDPATCTADGSTTYTATFTNPAFAEQSIVIVIAATGHDWEFVDFTWTETSDGYSAVANYVCKNDNGHTKTESAAVTSTTTPATCETAGQTVYTATHEGHTGTKTVTIPALGHDWEFIDFTWTETSDGCSAVANYKCRHDETHTKTEEATVTSATTPATCEAAGETVYTATHEGHTGTKTVAIPALGHDWNATTYDWVQEGENWKCTATRVCKNDASHIETETVTASRTEDGNNAVYTATFANSAFGTQIKRVELCYYLVGEMTGWKVNADYRFGLNSEAVNGPEYWLQNVNLTLGTELKVVRAEGDIILDWYPDNASNYIVDYAHSGNVNVYFRPAGNYWNDFHEGGFFYISKTHNVIVDNVGNGTATVDYAKPDFSQTVTVTATPNEGYHYDRIEFYEKFGEGENDIRVITLDSWNADDMTFKMPDFDVVIKVYFEVNYYTIKWIVDGNEETQTYAYGAMPTHADPTKPADAQYTYAFTGWDPEITTVTGDATYTAQFSQTLNTYKITWVIDGESTTETYAYGATPTHADPTKEADAQYTYTFTGWTPEITTVTGDATYTAVFSETVNKYTVIWKNYNGEILETDKDVPYGTIPTYNGETPAKPGNAQHSYTFNGWDPAISEVHRDVVYTAKFTEATNTYTVTWNNYDGSLLEKDTDVAYGETPEYDGKTPAKPSDDEFDYSFIGWTPAITAVTGNTTYTATFKAVRRSYEINFVNYDNSPLLKINVPYGETPEYTGETPIKPADAQYTYAFSGWDPAIVPVTGTATYTAQFSSTVNNYTVTWIIDGKEETETYAYGATPTHADPTKEADAQYTYAFTGWDPAITTVTGDVTYTAVFSETVNTYTITWVIDGVSTTETYDYGATPTHADPVKDPDDQNTYAFTGWDPEIAEVTGDATYTAQFESETRKYTITWTVNGEDITSDVPYGTMPKYPGETPTKPSDDLYDYTFTGWSPDLAEVTGEASYTAEFEKTLNSKGLTVKVELTAAAAIDRTYLFEISKDGEVIVIVPVTVKAGTLAASVLVKGLSAEGGYTVKEITAWSWDHEVTNGPSKPAAAEGEVLFINKRRNVSWLFSEAWLAF